MKKPQKGDWVRFYRDARLVIGEVQYVKTQNNDVELMTDAGAVDADMILEVRAGAA